MPVKLPILWDGFKDQNCKYDGSIWSVIKLIECSKDLEVFDYCLNTANMSHCPDFGPSTLHFAAHYNKIKNADLKYPIILHPEGSILDGRHRVIKALAEGKNKIKAVRFNFDNLPYPCSTYDIN